MGFNYIEQLIESKKRCVEIVKPIIPLRKDLDNLNLNIQELVKERNKLREMISEHQNVQKSVPAAFETIEIEIKKLKEKLNAAEAELENQEEIAKETREEITEIERYIAVIRTFYKAEINKNYVTGVNIYTLSDGDLALTEQIILGDSNDWTSTLVKDAGLTIKSVMSIMREIDKFVNE